MIPLVKPYIAPSNEMMPEIEKILYSGYIADGESVKKFETEFANFIGVSKVVSTSSGTGALHIALILLGVGVGSEVISTALTAEPTNTTIALTGANVVWADVEKDTGLIDPKDIERKITDKTKAIMVVHYAGMVCDMNSINRLSKKYNIPVIEDLAHSFGAKFDGKQVGSNSPYNCFSFQAIKHFTTIDGGMLTFNESVEENIIEQAKRLKWFGLSKNVPRLENDIINAGYKYNMNNVTATIGSVQLKHINRVLNCNINNGRYFDENLKNVCGVTLLKYHDNTEPSYWLYTMKVEKRSEFIAMMEKNNIVVSPLHYRNDYHSLFNKSRCELPHLDEFYDSFVHIPCGWWLTDEQKERMVCAIKKGW